MHVKCSNTLVAYMCALLPKRVWSVVIKCTVMSSFKCRRSVQCSDFAFQFNCLNWLWLASESSNCLPPVERNLPKARTDYILRASTVVQALGTLIQRLEHFFYNGHCFRQTGFSSLPVKLWLPVHTVTVVLNRQAGIVAAKQVCEMVC